MGKIAKPKLDFVFKKIFGDANNSDLLIDFLSSVLDVPTDRIQGIEIIDNEIIPDTVEKKFSRLDLLLLVNNEYINIEIQVNNYNEQGKNAVLLGKGVHQSAWQKRRLYIFTKYNSYQYS